MENKLLYHIIKTVNEEGDYSIPLDTLKPAFGCDGMKPVSIKENILLWAVENQIIFEYREVDQNTIVRFFTR